MLIGRNVELAGIAARLDAARSGRGGLLLVAGEAGVGKSSLATAAADAATSTGVPVRWGRCRETEGAPAYWPWSQVFAGEPRTDPALAPLWHGSDGMPGDRFRLFDAATRLLTEPGTAGPALVVLDDLHRADEGSLALLSFAVPVLGRSAVVVLGTYRPAEAGAGHPLNRLIGEAAGDALEHLDLGGLSPAAAAELVERLGVPGSTPPACTSAPAATRSSSRS